VENLTDVCKAINWAHNELPYKYRQNFSSEVNKQEENINSSQNLLLNCDVFISNHWAISFSGAYSKFF
jgi:hypothetical protein